MLPLQRMQRLKNNILWGLGLVTLIIVGWLSIILTVGMSINLELFSTKIEELLSKAIKSPVTINGPIVLTVSRTPSLLVNDVNIHNLQRDGGKVNVKRIDVRLSSIPYGAPTGIEAQLEFDKGRITLSGLIKEPDKLKGIDINVAFQSEQLEAINFFTKYPFPELGQIQLTGELHDSETGFELGNIKGNVGDIVFTGNMGLNVKDKQPRFVANIVVKSFDLEKYGRHYAERNSKRKQLKLPSISDYYRLLMHLNIDCKLNIISLRYAQTILNNLQVDVHLTEQKLNVSKYKFVYQDNTYTGIASINLDDVIAKSGTDETAILPLDLTINHSDITASMKGEVTQPFILDRVSFSIKANGQNLANAGSIINRELPEIGPYDLKGQLSFADKKLSLAKFMGHIGGSAFSGNLSIQLNRERPKFIILLAADKFDINDLAPRKVKTRAELVRAIKNKSFDNKTGTQELINLKALRKFDAYVSVKIGELNNREDTIKNIIATLNLHDGLLKVDPLDVTFPEGRVNTTLIVDARNEIVKTTVSLVIDRFDYGSLVRILRPDAKGEGWLNADIELDTKGKSLQELLSSANGHFNVAIWPENLSTDFLDLWTQGLLHKILDTLDPNVHSKMNCIIAYFDVKNGVMKSNRIVLDTSRINVNATGTFNLKNKELDFILRPRPKTPALTSTSIPMKITGKLPDYEIKPQTGGVAGGIIKLYTNLIVVPYQYMVHGSLPEDGRLVCGVEQE